jgi:hypothetical protein
MSFLIITGGLAVQPTLDVINSWFLLAALFAFTLGYIQSRMIRPHYIIFFKALIMFISYTIFTSQILVVGHGMVILIVDWLLADLTSEQANIIQWITAGVYALIGLTSALIARLENQNVFSRR